MLLGQKADNFLRKSDDVGCRVFKGGLGLRQHDVRIHLNMNVPLLDIDIDVQLLSA